MDIEESSWVMARYKDVFSEYNIEEYLDFDELYIDCFSCSVKYDNSFCNKIKLYTDQVQFYTIASYKIHDDPTDPGNLYTKQIGFLGIYRKESFNEKSYVDFSENLRLTYADLKDKVVYQNENVVVINFIDYLDDDLLEFYFSDFQGKEALFKDLLSEFIENNLLTK